MTKKNNVLLGTVLGSILGSVSAAMLPKDIDALATINDQKNKWSEKARRVSEKLYSDVSNWGEPKTDIATRNFIAGALVGLLVGAGSTAILTPKSGKQLRKNISNQYQNVADKTQDVLDFINTYAGSARPVVKKAVRKARSAISSLNGSTRKIVKKAAAKTLTSNSPKKKASRSRSKAKHSR